MKVCIHRGAQQIGGSLVEIESAGQRLVLDAGLPLDSDGVPSHDLLPPVPGLWSEGDGSLQALVISHPHPDHYGLADHLDPSVPIFLGEAATTILAEAAFFVPSMRPIAVTGHLRHREMLDLGAFKVTPWLVDHSAFDSYALLVEADGRRLLYTGDIRAHGRKSGSLDTLARDVGAIDVLLMEGTRIQPTPDSRSAMTESDVELACAELFTRTDGMALAFYSPQNVDRLVTLFRAAKRSGRTFVMDLYAASIAAATGRPTIPQSTWDEVRVYLPHSQRRRVIDQQAFGRTDAIRASRIYADELRERASDLVVTCRASMLGELERAECLGGAEAIWSMWSGYLARGSGQVTEQRLEALGIPLTPCHASGHATPDDLHRFATAVDARQVVPIHTEHPAAFAETLRQVDLRADGVWWSV